MNGFRITLAAGVAAAMALVSMPAKADEQSGFALGVRIGYAVPFGAVRSGYSLASADGGMIPFRADVGYRFNPHAYLGGYFQYGLTFPPQSSGCLPGASCSGDDLSGGISFQYHILPAQNVDPWVGVGLGYEVSRTFNSVGSDIADSSYVYKGYNFDLMAGADLGLSKLVPFGPFVDFTMGRFFHESFRDENGTSTNLDMQSKLHEWLTFGLRGQFNL